MQRVAGLLMIAVIGLLLMAGGTAGAADDTPLTLDNVYGVWGMATGPNGTPYCLVCSPPINAQSTTVENRVMYGRQIDLSCDGTPLQLKSGMGFDGSSGGASITPGELFLLGEFTHYNRPLAAFPPDDPFDFRTLSAVPLTLSLQFDSPSLTAELDYIVHLEETDNIAGTCIYAGTSICPDRISFAETLVSDTFVVDEVAYTLQIAGFTPGLFGGCLLVSNVEPVGSFITEESTDNQGCLWGRVLVAEPSISVDKTANVPTVTEGGPAGFTIVVTNTGALDLTGVGIVDNVQAEIGDTGVYEPAGACDFLTGPDKPDPDDVLAPGEAWVYGCVVEGVTRDLLNTATASGVATVDNTEIPVEDEDDATVMVNPAPTAGALNVTKQIGWGEAEMTSVNFEICITGPSYPATDCQTVTDPNGQTVQWTNLIPGAYSVGENFPGGDWLVLGNDQTVTVLPGATAWATISNIYNSAGEPPPPICDGRDLRLDLSGVIVNGGRTGQVTNNGPEACLFQIGMASYYKYNEVIDEQDIYDYQNTFFAIPSGATVTLNVGLPPCAAQVDLFYGPVLFSLDGARYGERLLAAWNIGGTDYCPRP
jgi:uncharacterized repeat protein (TIGR01451 family)